jgi:hypothetical protein
MYDDTAKQKIDEIYTAAMRKLEELAVLQKKIISEYLNELEGERVKRLKEELSK